MHEMYDIHCLLNEYSFITYCMPVAALIYTEVYLFKEHDSFPNKFDINSSVSITLMEQSHYWKNHIVILLLILISHRLRVCFICDDGFKSRYLWKDANNFKIWEINVKKGKCLILY